jgi:hypothetical protein
MSRLAILGLVAGLASLALSINAATAQESGGVALSPEVLQTQNAQGQVLDHVLARVQQLQQLRLLGLNGGAVASSNLANPAIAAPNGGQSTPLGAGDALSLASTLRQRALQNSDPGFVQNVYQQQLVDNSQSLTVNAPNSSVVLGSNNIVKQQVTTSTAISPTGNATASAGVANGAAHHGTGKNKAQTNQTATSSATSVGGTAQAVAINTTIAPQVSN